MKAPGKLLLLCLLVLSTASPHAKSSCGTLAKVRAAIPGNAKMPRYLLHIFHKLTRDEICKNPSQSFSASRFLLAEGLTIGTLLQQWAGTMEDFMWENWVRNYSREKLKFKWDVDNMINHTMLSLENQASFFISNLERNMGGQIYLTTANEIDAMIKNISSFSKDDFYAFVEDLTCHFHGSVKHSKLEKFIKADGVETINDNNLKEILQTIQKVVLAEASDLLRTIVGKLKPLLGKFQPEMKTYENNILKLQSGNNPKLENFLFRILQEIQTDGFLRRLDTFVKNSCVDIGHYTTTFFMNILGSLEELSSFVGSSVNKNNKLDLQSLATQFHIKFGKTFDTRVYDFLDSRFADFEVGLKNGDYVYQLVYFYLPAVFPACRQFDECQKWKEILIEHADLLVGGAFRAFVKKFRIFRKTTRGGKVLACQIDCSADCPDMNRDMYDPDGPQDSPIRICMSKRGCNKNLFFDPEC